MNLNTSVYMFEYGIVTLIDRHEHGSNIGGPHADIATSRHDTIAAIRNNLWCLREIR